MSKELQTEALAEKIRTACIEAAKEGFMDASISGLCAEGAIEAAIGAMESLNLKTVIGQKSS